MLWTPRKTRPGLLRTVLRAAGGHSSGKGSQAIRGQAQTGGRRSGAAVAPSRHEAGVPDGRKQGQDARARRLRKLLEDDFKSFTSQMAGLEKQWLATQAALPDVPKADEEEVDEGTEAALALAERWLREHGAELE